MSRQPFIVLFTFLCTWYHIGSATFTLSSSISVEAQLSICENQSVSASSEFHREFTFLTKELEGLRKQLDSSVAKMVSENARMQAERDNLVSEIRERQRQLSSRNATLSTRIDCNANSHTIKGCSRYCKFPYGYDSCWDNLTKLTYVKELAARLNSYLMVYYVDDENRACVQFVVVT